jgi:hypothetical protein
LHLCMDFLKNCKMSLMQEKCIDGWPHNYFLFTVNRKLWIPLDVWWN